MASFLDKDYAFLKLSYWFNPNPVELGPALAGSIFFFFGWFIVAAVALALLARWLRKRDPLKRDICRRFANLIFWTGIFGEMALFFAYEMIPVFRMRFWFLTVFVIFIVWLIRTVIHVVRDYPREKARLAEKARMTKWLPKKKK